MLIKRTLCMLHNVLRYSIYGYGVYVYVDCKEGYKRESKEYNDSPEK